ncbi:aryl-sulfate sulfotransferase [Maribacter sp. MAR_2009_72]|uniref:aryl-sulfate sulfotransferase n=1 Tax=Maribacter sp. MAR_2009_72 TaxID=1250050 RepID=UPI00119BEADA|nr:aryl-sulfate sulfotransferase [Maribacter sp. MAR_2009_72]TVZ16833.1 arylsulfotransferase ASST [Maribacter sp. MAR_2009_72]
MRKKQINYCLLICLSLIYGVYSCTNADEIAFDINNPTLPEVEEDLNIDENFTPIGTVEIFNETKIDSNYILVNDASANRVYIMNKKAKLLHEWNLTNNIGNDVFLMTNGKLLASLESDEPKIPLGGKGGKIQIIEPDNTPSWEYIYSTENGETHHDVEMLPNGNIIAMVWSIMDSLQAKEEGFMLSENIYPESIIEINPTSSSIVWEWHSMDHLVQEFDDTKNNYGIINQNPHLIDINYSTQVSLLPEVKGDIMHANAIAYDENKDVIYLSVNSFSEVWVIDHSTSTEEASGHIGGNYNKGGDLIYRFGNPEAYGNTEGTRLFQNNHFPNLLKGEHLGKLLIFSNGNDIKQSTVYELQLPENFNLEANTDNEPTITWSFTDPDLYSGKVSGAVLLENGNILITEGDFGFWEVTREQEVVWKYSAPGFYWRGYPYLQQAPEIKLLGL